MKKLIYTACIISAIFIGANCNPQPDGATPFFSGTEEIELSYDGTNFSYTLPDADCKYIVLGCFSGDVQSTSDNSFVDSLMLKGGARTGKGIISSTSVPDSALMVYDPNINDFTSTALPTTSYYYIMWAYDSHMNLVASSTRMGTASMP